MTNEPIKLLLDEHVWEGLAEALTQRGYDVVHISNTGQRGMDDEPLLALATTQGRAVLTYNARHFVPLVRLWYEAGRVHAGVLLSTQLPPGELLRQVERLLATLSAGELKNTVRWLQEFKAES
jgi:predicted nuclease of predicted toxin-antitoxin system